MITPQELNGLTEAIFLRYGIDFRTYESVSLQRRVARLMYRYQLESVYHLWKKVLYEPDFIQTFINEITIGFTELFRNTQLWKYLQSSILPQYQAHDFARLKVWHAGCATGEEVYSMLILLYESHLLHKSQVMATDINTQWLEQVKQGTYPSELWDKFSTSYQQVSQKQAQDFSKYAQKSEDSFSFRDFIKQPLEVDYHNLTQNKMPQTYQLIFCRNVLIYFDDALKKQVLKTLYHSLAEGGYLVLGFYDALPEDIDTSLTLVEPSLKIFKK